MIEWLVNLFRRAKNREKTPKYRYVTHGHLRLNSDRRRDFIDNCTEVHYQNIKNGKIHIKLLRSGHMSQEQCEEYIKYLH